MKKAEMPFYVTQLPFMLKSSLNGWLQCLLRHVFLTVRSKYYRIVVLQSS